MKRFFAFIIILLSIAVVVAITPPAVTAESETTTTTFVETAEPLMRDFGVTYEEEIGLTDSESLVLSFLENKKEDTPEGRKAILEYLKSHDSNDEYVDGDLFKTWQIADLDVYLILFQGDLYLDNKPCTDSYRLLCGAVNRILEQLNNPNCIDYYLNHSADWDCEGISYSKGKFYFLEEVVFDLGDNYNIVDIVQVPKTSKYYMVFENQKDILLVTLDKGGLYSKAIIADDLAIVPTVEKNLRHDVLYNENIVMEERSVFYWSAEGHLVQLNLFDSRVERNDITEVTASDYWLLYNDCFTTSSESYISWISKDEACKINNIYAEIENWWPKTEHPDTILDECGVMVEYSYPEL